MSGWNSFLAILHVSCCSHYWGIRVHNSNPVNFLELLRFASLHSSTAAVCHLEIQKQAKQAIYEWFGQSNNVSIQIWCVYLQNISCSPHTREYSHLYTHTHTHNRWEDRTSLWISSVPSSLSRPPSLQLCDALPLLACRLVHAPANVHVFGVRKETEAVLPSAYKTCGVCEEHFMCVKTILCYNEYL